MASDFITQHQEWLARMEKITDRLERASLKGAGEQKAGETIYQKVGGLDAEVVAVLYPDSNTLSGRCDGHDSR